MRMLIRSTAFLLVTALVLAGGHRALACVGKTLQVGVIAGGGEELLSRMFSVLVNERTGTSVKMREFANFGEAFAALRENDVDVVLASSGQAMAEVLKKGRAASGEEALDAVRSFFNERFNLVWLDPWGATDDGSHLADSAGAPLPSQLAPLARKETLKEFPALARLVNKMAGRLDAARLAALLEQAAGADWDRVARDYLKSEKLI